MSTEPKDLAHEERVTHVLRALGIMCLHHTDMPIGKEPHTRSKLHRWRGILPEDSRRSKRGPYGDVEIELSTAQSASFSGTVRIYNRGDSVAGEPISHTFEGASVPEEAHYADITVTSCPANLMLDCVAEACNVVGIVGNEVDPMELIKLGINRDRAYRLAIPAMIP